MIGQSDAQTVGPSARVDILSALSEAGPTPQDTGDRASGREQGGPRRGKAASGGYRHHGSATTRIALAAAPGAGGNGGRAMNALWNWVLIVSGALLVLVEVAFGGFAGFDLVLIGSAFLIGGGAGL